MKKKIYLGIAVLLIVAGVVGLTVAMRNSNETPNDATKPDQTGMPTTVADAKAKAKAQRNTPKCLAANEQLTPSDSDTKGIEMGAVSQLLDVPAGTETTVSIAAYDGSHATGSELYPKDYGTYNFTAEKDPTVPADSEYSWKITSFTACKK